MPKVTEEEAKAKWCPEPDTGNCIGTRCMVFEEAGTRLEAPDPPGKSITTQLYRCGLSRAS